MIDIEDSNNEVMSCAQIEHDQSEYAKQQLLNNTTKEENESLRGNI
jgi:hypothetical protein